jgi:hypothetical protein
MFCVAKRAARAAAHERAARRSHLPDDDAAWRTTRRDYLHLLKIMRGHGRAQAVDAIDAALFHDFFDKVGAVRDSTAGAEPPIFRRAATDSELSSSVDLSAAEVVAAIHRLPDKQCASDLLLTRLLYTVR